ncbi:MAG: heavy metal translocating P-type ATPase [Myxococcota bacterium]
MTEEVLLPVRGMTCAACAARLERSLGRAEGVSAVEVNFATEAAKVSFDPSVTDAIALVGAVERAGFQVPPGTIHLVIEGMTCASCTERVERALRQTQGVLSAQVNFASGDATVAVVEGAASTASLLDAVATAGYKAALGATSAEAAAEQARREHREERREALVVMGALLLALPLVMPMALLIVGVHWMLPFQAQLVLALPVQLVAGARFYRGAVHALRSGSANMDVLVALGTTAAFALSVFLGTRGEAHLYFEAAAAVIALVRLGKWLELRARRSTRSALTSLLSLRPAMVRVLRGAQELSIPLGAVGRGEVVVVRPGEKIPVDGPILSGEASVDESLLTGESRAQHRGPGDDVIGGSLNLDGYLQVRAARVGDDARLAQIISLVQGAQASKAPVQHLVDRVAAVFVPLVLCVAAITLVGWWLAGADLEGTLLPAVSVLVIACPCALGLATPAALVVGTGVAARAGILVRDAASLEKASQVTHVVFDKTGTLTEGRPAVQRIASLQGDDDEVLRLAASVQQGSEHPVGKALLIAAAERNLSLLPIVGFQSMPGRGVSATIDGHEVQVGSARLLVEQGVDKGELDAIGTAAEAAGSTSVYVATEKCLRGVVVLSDREREGAAKAVAQLKSMGLSLTVLTGDLAGVAQRSASSLGIEHVRSEVLPEDKAEEVASLRRAGAVVAMVGDGVNDAPALAAADLGIALGTGTDVAKECAGVTLMRPDLRLVAETLSLARVTTRKIRQNLFWAFAYNVLGIPLAAAGVLTPLVAGAAMAFSSVSVLLNALSLRRMALTTRVPTL